MATLAPSFCSAASSLGRWWTASRSNAAPTRAGRRSPLAAWRKIFLPCWLARLSIWHLASGSIRTLSAYRHFRGEHVRSGGDQAYDGAGYPRPQGRQADRVADLVSRSHGPSARRLLRLSAGGRLSWHGDARTRIDRAGHARYDDPSGPGRHARQQARAGRGRYAVRLLRGIARAGVRERFAHREGNGVRGREARG